MIAPPLDAASRNVSVSICLKCSSPSRAINSTTAQPTFASITRSRSINWRSSFAASIGPTVDLPLAINPRRKIGVWELEILDWLIFHHKERKAEHKGRKPDRKVRPESQRIFAPFVFCFALFVVFFRSIICRAEHFFSHKHKAYPSVPYSLFLHSPPLLLTLAPLAASSL